MQASTPREAIWLVLARIPPGKVATYGQVAALSGLPRRARYVGTVLKQLPEGSSLPWHRVINARGEIAFAPGSAQWRQQRKRLIAEGVPADDGRISLKHHQWRP